MQIRIASPTALGYHYRSTGRLRSPPGVSNVDTPAFPSSFPCYCILHGIAAVRSASDDGNLASRVAPSYAAVNTATNTVYVANELCSAYPCPNPGTVTFIDGATNNIKGTGYMGYLTLWPDSEGQPVVSTLNAADGMVTSNMAVVPNVNGNIDAYAAGLTQLILDISGYFAP